MSSTDDRFREDTLAEQALEERRGWNWWDDWCEWNRTYQEQAAIDPEVAAIMAGWEAGGTEPPWTDAAPDGNGKNHTEETAR